MNAQELHAIVSELPEERWPDDELTYGSGYGWYRIRRGDGIELIGDRLALLIWEGHLSRKVAEAGYREYAFADRWATSVGQSATHPTRIEALVAAVKGLE